MIVNMAETWQGKAVDEPACDRGACHGHADRPRHRRDRSKWSGRVLLMAAPAASGHPGATSDTYTPKAEVGGRPGHDTRG